MQEKQEDSFKCYMVSWDKACRLAKNLSRKIKKSGFEPDLVVGIARGGLVPARIVCDFLLQKNLAVIKVEHWGLAHTLGEAKVKSPLTLDISQKKILIVDDVADTGDTFSKTFDHIKGMDPAEIRTAVLHYKTCSTSVPDYWAEKQDKWKWIVYPWALHEDMAGFIEKVLTGPETAEDIRKGLKSGFGIKTSGKDLPELLNDMHAAGKLRRWKKSKKILWEKVKTPAEK